jgi:ribosomal protein RSM22 (predicted rRNA methylase)
LTALAALAYAATRMPATYAALRRVFAEIGDQEEIASVHDIGAGTGAGAWAVREAFGASVAITCEERDAAMAALGSTLAPFAAWGSPAAEADLVLISYVLGETQDFAAFARDAWRLARKFLVIVEPGTPRGFDRIAALRSLGPVVAPCPGWGAQPCPVRTSTEKDWCHFAARVERTALHRQLKGGELSHEDEKFSYLILAKQPPATAASYSRIVRHPFIEPGQIQLQLCDGAAVHKVTVRKRTNPDAFRVARKADWGDRWTSGD